MIDTHLKCTFKIFVWVQKLFLLNIFCTLNPKVIQNSKKVPSLQDRNGIPAMYVNWESFYLSHLLAHELDGLFFFLFYELYSSVHCLYILGFPSFLLVF